MTPIPIPQQVPVTEATAMLPGAHLWYWDTGGNGEPIVLIHPASGSGLIWLYQQPIFAKKGYRVIGYSRRGFYKSDPIDRANPGIASEDLHNLIEFLGLKTFHAVSCAAGGGVAVDYAISHPDRLRSLVVSNNPAGVREGYIAELWLGNRPQKWKEFPRWFWEVGPSYRAANPEGLRLWKENEEKSITGYASGQKSAHVVTEKTLESLETPILLMTGEADLATPPYILRMVAKHIRHREVVIVPESGHSAYWECPDIFNREVRDFVNKH